MRVAGLIGNPVEHSLSPAMHNAAFAALGIDARYELWPTDLDDLPDRIAGLRHGDILGANVTVPHKAAVMPLLDEVTDTARRIGAVNTIIPRDGRLVGDNTDAFGFRQSLDEATAGRSTRSALVVGAGGAARAVLVALQDAGIGDLRLVNRTVEKAVALAGSLSAPGKPAIRPAPWAELGSIAASASLVVNATSIGWHGDELPFDPAIVAALPGDAVVMDLTYRQTALLRMAGDRGLRAADGLPMLIHQGARAFTLWTRQDAPVTAMTSAVREAYARRS
jgi:shikimate dehydrogenase